MKQEDNSMDTLTVRQLLNVAQKIQRGEAVAEEDRRAYEVAVQKIKATMAKLQTDYSARFQEFRLSLAKFRSSFKNAESMVKSVTDKAAPAIANLVRNFHELPPRVRAALLTLGESGWYLSGEMGFSSLWTLESLLRDGKVAEVDRMLSKYFESQTSTIETQICELFPHRANIIHAAFKAHLRGEFELSVPVFLTQVDGVCSDTTGKAFFMRRDKRPEVASHVDGLPTPYEAAWLSPLASVLPINASKDERKSRMKAQGTSSWFELNRHMVLHGESVDYGTLTNSLKTISLLDYVASVLVPPEGISPRSRRD